MDSSLLAYREATDEYNIMLIVPQFKKIKEIDFFIFCMFTEFVY